MTRAHALSVLGVLASAALGVVLFLWVRFPLPFLTGSLAGAAVFSMCGGKAWMPPYSRESAQVVLGTAIGQTINAAILLQIGERLPIMVAAACISIICGLLIGRLIVRFSTTDRTTAFYATIPGGVAEMAVIADRAGGRAPTVAIAQSFRVALTVFIIPFALVALGIHGDFIASTAAFAPNPLWTLPALAAGLVLAFILRAGRIPNPWLFAGIIIGIAGALELPETRLIPGWLVNTGQTLLGIGLGMRFTRKALIELAAFLPFAVLSTLGLILTAFVAALVLHKLTGVDLGTLVLGMAPGGAAEMSLTARAQHFDVGLVAAFHIMRIIIVLILCQPLHALSARW